MIFLDEQTRPYLERLIKKQIEKSDKDFIAQRINKMLEADQERLDSIAQCNHKTALYTGHKECCVYCGALGSEEWTLDKEVK